MLDRLGFGANVTQSEVEHFGPCNNWYEGAEVSSFRKLDTSAPATIDMKGPKWQGPKCPAYKFPWRGRSGLGAEVEGPKWYWGAEVSSFQELTHWRLSSI